MKEINHEYYVSPEVAKLLKQAGFDWECRMIHFCYVEDDNMWNLEDNHKQARRILKLDYCLLAPTLEVAQRWLREVKHKSIEVKSFVDGTVENIGKWWIWHVYNFNPPIDWVFLRRSGCRYSTYEEAQEAGIKKALEIILKKEE